MITAEDIAKEFYPLLYSHQRDYLRDQINAAIAAAVAAEREACAKVADDHEESANALLNYRAEDEAQRIAAAIRARGNGSK